MGTITGVLVAVSAVLVGLGFARPQGGLPIADLLPGQNVQFRPQDDVTLFDLTRDSINEVNAPEPPGRSPSDDITFQFPAGNAGGPPEFAVGPPGGNLGFRPGGSERFGPGNGLLGPPVGNPGFGRPGNNDFRPSENGPLEPPGGNPGFGPPGNGGFGPHGNGPLGSPGGNLGFGPSGSSGFGQPDSGIPSKNPAYLPSGSPSSPPKDLPVVPIGSEDVQFNFPDTFPPEGQPSVPSSGSSPSDDVQFNFPDTSSPGGLPSVPSIGVSSSGDVQLLFPDTSPPLGSPSEALADLSFSSPGTPNDVSLSGPSYENSAPSHDFGLQDVPKLASLDLVSEVPSRSLGDGNRKGLRNQVSDNDELLALLTLGLLGNPESATHGRPAHRPTQHVPLNPIKKLLNLLTLGLFDPNRSHSQNPLNDIFNRLTFGLFTNNTRRPSNKPHLDLSALGLNQDTLDSLAQVASAGFDDIARETSAGLRLVGDEIQFMSREQIQKFIQGFQQTGRTVSNVGQNTYRSVLQKQDVIGRLLMGSVENLGNFANSASSKTFESVGNAASTIGRFINDLKVGLVNALIAKGEAVRKLFNDSLETSGKAFNDFTKASREAAEDNIRAIAGLRPFR